MGAIKAREKVQEILFNLFLGVFNYRSLRGRYITDSFAKLPPYDIVSCSPFFVNEVSN